MSPRTRADIPHILIMMGAVLLFILVSARYARAEANLPGNVTCEQVVQYAQMLQIPNTWRGRAQARVIALTFGVVLTDAHFAAAARCLQGNKN